MSGDLEQDLRQALRPVELRPAFANKLLAAVLAERRASSVPKRSWLRPSAAAASVVLAISLSWGAYQHQQHERASQAHAELLKALAITDRSLDRAYQALQSRSADRMSGG
jgi:hypothetical protein